MIKTIMTERLGIKYPIIQAGMGPFGTNNLCIGAANAGVLGIVSCSGFLEREAEGYADICKSSGLDPAISPPEALKEVCKITARETHDDARFGVNMLVTKPLMEIASGILEPVLMEREKDPLLKKKMSTIITSAGDPVPWAEFIRRFDIQWVHVSSSVKAAKRCEKAGVDFIVASGHEGGFHIAWEPVHSMVLMPAVVDACPDTPVIGAGGYSDGRSLVSALGHGGVGMQMGTRFIATQEGDFQKEWKEAIIGLNDRSTQVARGFVGPARFLRTKYTAEHAQDTLRWSPGCYVGIPDRDPSPEFIKKEEKAFNATYYGRTDEALYAGGECSQRLTDLPTCQELVDRIMKEAEETINKLPGFLS